jgi:hypothetical protein
MEAKQKTTAQVLAEARAKGRAHLEHFELRKHADLWGMKTFSWMNAGWQETLELLTQMENPVIWLVSSEEADHLQQHAEMISREVHAVIAFGPSSTVLRNSLEGKVAFYTRKDSFHEALQVMKSVANPGYNLLVAPGNNKLNTEWTATLDEFVAAHSGC